MGEILPAQEIQDIQETIESCGWSWTELLQTICEHLQCMTPLGRYKVDSSGKALKKLEAQGLVRLPARRVSKAVRQEIGPGERTHPQDEVTGTVRDQLPIEQFQENLKLLFPELDSVPHQDTLARLLAHIEVAQIQGTD